MENKLSIITKESELFGQVRFTIIEGKEYAVGIDVAVALGYKDASGTVSKKCKNGIKQLINVGCQNGNSHNKARNTQEMTLIPESDIYRLIFGSKLESAEKFQDWVFDEVLPQIRQTGGYIPVQEEMTDDEIMARALIVAQNTIKKKDELISQQKKEIENKNNELDYKEDVIIGLVKDISLAEKRQRISQIIRHNHNNYSERYGLLYKELEKKYHLDIQRRMENAIEKGTIKKSMKKMEYICNIMNMTNELYEICCKLFENDFNSLVDEFKNGIA